MDNYTKAGSWELPTYQADLALPQTQAQIKLMDYFKKYSWLLSSSSHHSGLPWAPRRQHEASMGCTKVEPGTWVGSVCQARKPHLHIIKSSMGEDT